MIARYSESASKTQSATSAVHELRAKISASKPPFGQAQYLAERAQVTSREIPEGIYISCELAPPSSQIPPSIYSTLIQPGQVPVFFYSDAPAQSFTQAKKGIKSYFGHPTEQRFISFFSDILRAFGKKPGAQGSSALIIAVSSRGLATASENLFPALQDLFSACHHLILKGFAPNNITVTGDGAGGNLVM
ncbi:uncharacterized protein EDB93DRAFT_341270 [Suillus bovinus]|uniref:uncharacterized protein n=1 Tax=Suillus bovinus TaxID=48563 RepID=UPI001B8829AC|nr:uncharacterized protein EDB93DRAFT_341270 [Suillus bovinus]KAG2150253.1 hypothetical protein EDB93DRAFT_341270 [Suillus bovinus]